MGAQRATVTVVTCSAALPTIGKMIKPIKASLSLLFPMKTALIESTMNSAQTAMRPVEISKSITAVVREIFSSSSSLVLGRLAATARELTPLTSTKVRHAFSLYTRPP